MSRRLFRFGRVKQPLKSNRSRKAQKEKRLKSYDGRDLFACDFRLKALRPATSGGKGKGGGPANNNNVLARQRRMAAVRLIRFRGFTNCRWSSRGELWPFALGESKASAKSGLSASEAAWVSKGDCLTIRGKTNFSFGWPEPWRCNVLLLGPEASPAMFGLLIEKPSTSLFADEA